MAFLGDFDTGGTLYGKFTTYRPSTGATFTLGGTPALSVYKDASTTQSTAGVTLTADFDTVTGLNHFAIDTSADGTFYAAGSQFDIVIMTGTVDGVSVVGSVVASFSLRRDSALKPTTAARTLDVSAGGEAGLDWANIGSPATAVNLSGTNIDVDQVVASVSGAVGSVTGNVGGSLVGNVGGSVVGSVGSVAADGITATSIAVDAFGALELAAGAASEIATAVRTQLTTELGRIDATVSSRATQTSVDTIDDFLDTEVAAIKTVTDKMDDTLELTSDGYIFTAFALEQAPTAAIADAVWDEALAGHLSAGSTGEALNAAGAAGDPWTTALPGAYGAGSAGKIIGDNINATISSRATQTSVDDLPTNAELATALGTADDAVLAILGTPAGASLSADVAAVKTQTAAIEVDTQDIQSRLPAALVSGRIDASVGAMAANVMTAAAAAADLTTEFQSGLATAAALNTVDDFLDTEIAAIKAKTDNLPANPAATGDIPTATQNADALLNRDMSAVSDTNSRSPLNALRFLRNKWSIAGTDLTVTKENDTTAAWTATVTAAPGADPISGSDPA